MLFGKKYTYSEHTPAQADSPQKGIFVDLTPAAMEALGVNGPVNTRQVHVDWDFV